MANWSRDKVDASNLNNGQEYTIDSDVSVEQLNSMVNSGLYSQDFVEALTDTPVVENDETGASPSVELVDNVKNGKTYKKFKFKNLSNATSKLYDTTGENTDGAMTQKATTNYVDEKVGYIVNGAPDDYDTLQKIAIKVQTNETSISALKDTQATKNYVDFEVGSLRNELTPTIEGKVDKVTGKGLSTNDYTDAEKSKLAELSNYDDTEVKSLINAKYTKPSTGIPKTDLTSAVQTSLNKADTALQSVPSEYVTETELTNKGYATTSSVESKDIATLNSAKSYTDTKVSGLVNSAPETLDTLGELATALQENESVVETLNSAIGNKVDKVSGKGLSSNDYTTVEKNKLAGIEAGAQVNPTNYVTTDGGEQTVGGYKTFTGLATFKNNLTLNDTSTLYPNNRFNLSANERKLSISYSGATGNDPAGIALEIDVNTNITNFKTTPTVNGVELATKSDVEESGGIVVDEELSSTSGNPVQNKVINARLESMTQDHNLLKTDVVNLNNQLLNKANKTDIPTKTSQLTNDSGFLTSSPSNMATTDTAQTISGAKSFTTHQYFKGGVASSSTGNTSQIVMAKPDGTQQWALTSNDKTFIVNPTTSSTAGQLVCNLGSQMYMSGADLGRSAGKWKDLYLSGGIYNNSGNKLTLPSSAGTLALTSQIPSAITVDSALSSTSTNPVQNKVINTALGNKVDKVSGKGLSTNDYTTAEKTKLSGIAEGANKTVVDDYLTTVSTNPVQNKVVYNEILLRAKTDLSNVDYPLNSAGSTTTGAGDRIIETYISSDKKTWYRKWKSGWKEMGGTVYSTGGWATLTLPISFSNANYKIVGSYSDCDEDNGGVVCFKVASKTTSSCRYAITWVWHGNGYSSGGFSGTRDGIDWYACGY